MVETREGFKSALLNTIATDVRIAVMQINPNSVSFDLFYEDAYLSTENINTQLVHGSIREIVIRKNIPEGASALSENDMFIRADNAMQTAFGELDADRKVFEYVFYNKGVTA